MFCWKKIYQNQVNGKIANLIFQRHRMKKQVIGLHIYGLHITISALNWELNCTFIPYDTELIECLRMTGNLHSIDLWCKETGNER